MDYAVHRISHYAVDIVVCFVDSYPIDSVIYGRLSFEQLRPAVVSAVPRCKNSRH